jgi:hypothetical protein
MKEKKIMLKKFAVSIGIMLSALSLNACDGIKDTFGVANRLPVIASFDYSPKSGMTRNDIITFTVVANDPEGKPLQFNWTATKGILSANSGNTVSWRPIKLDGSFESGLSNVSVLVSDGVMTNSANVNIFMQGESVTIATPNVTPSVMPSSSTSPSPTVAPTIAPTISPVPSSTVLPTIAPTPIATIIPTSSPTAIPTVAPTPSTVPTSVPSQTVVSPSPSSTMIVTQ